MTLTLDCDVVIHAPPERVFASMTDPGSARQWMKGLVSIEVLTSGPFGKGTVFRETRKMFGKEASELFEVRAWDPPRSFQFYVDGTKGATGKGEFIFDHTLTPTAEGTHVRLHGTIQMPGGFMLKMFSGLMASMFKKSIDKDLQALKAFIEKGGG